MVETVAGWIYGTLGIVFVVFTVVWNILRLIKAIKCRKTKYPCEDMQCVYRYSCSKYDKTMELLYFRMDILREQIRRDEMKQIEK